MLDIKDYGINLELENDSKYLLGRVVAVHRDLFKVICEHGECDAILKRGIYYNNKLNEIFPTTGDFVLLQYNDFGDSLIVKTMPRKSKFSRPDFSGHMVGYVKTVLEQVVAANFDYVFILASLNKDFNIKRIERYITVALQSGGTPVVVLTKADLLEDYSVYINEIKKINKSIDVFAVSAHNGYGLESFDKYMKKGNTIIFIGSSGVGKSSLVNALAKEDIMKVNEIREDDAKGRHTTTHRQLIMLRSGVMIIDTPGMRELGMFDVSEGLNEAFDDINKLINQCKFNDCTHTKEPGCAINKALKDGSLDKLRWERYNLLKSEAKFSHDKKIKRR